jgi:hypothetical protein
MPKLALAALLTETCDIYERVSTYVGKQPVEPTPTVRATGVPCSRVWPVSSKEQATLIGRMVTANRKVLVRTPDLPTGFGSEWEIQVGAERYRVAEADDAGGAGEATTVLMVVVPS